MAKQIELTFPAAATSDTDENQKLDALEEAVRLLKEGAKKENFDRQFEGLTPLEQMALCLRIRDAAERIAVMGEAIAKDAAIERRRLEREGQ